MAASYDVESGHIPDVRTQGVKRGVGLAYDPRAFDDARGSSLIRQGFVRKVYATLAGQLLLTAAIARPIGLASDMWLAEHSYLALLATAGFLVFALAAACGLQQKMMRRHPVNMLALLGFTLCESVIVGFTCAIYEAESVMLCLVATTLIVGALTAVAFSTNIAVARWRVELGVCSLVVAGLGLLGRLLHIPLLQMVYAYAAAILFAGFLVYDTQRIAGGRDLQGRFEVDDYFVAAMTVYLDMVRFFMLLLRIAGTRRRERR